MDELPPCVPVEPTSREEQTTRKPPDDETNADIEQLWSTMLAIKQAEQEAERLKAELMTQLKACRSKMAVKGYEHNDFWHFWAARARRYHEQEAAPVEP